MVGSEGESDAFYCCNHAAAFDCHAGDCRLFGLEKVAYKKENPNELAYFVQVDDDCPVTKKEAIDITEGVFIRSRIKPVPDKWNIDSLYLYISLDCLKIEGDNPVYHFSVRFANASAFIPVDYIERYGSLGIGPKSAIVNTLKDKAEAALTDYIKVNFDLGG